MGGSGGEGGGGMRAVGGVQRGGISSGRTAVQGEGGEWGGTEGEAVELEHALVYFVLVSAHQFRSPIIAHLYVCLM